MNDRLVYNLKKLEDEIENPLGMLSKIKPNFRERFLRFLESILNIEIDLMKSDKLIRIQKRYSTETKNFYIYIGLCELDYKNNETFSGGRVWLTKNNSIDIIQNRRD